MTQPTAEQDANATLESSDVNKKKAEQSFRRIQKSPSKSPGGVSMQETGDGGTKENDATLSIDVQQVDKKVVPGPEDEIDTETT